VEQQKTKPLLFSYTLYVRLSRRRSIYIDRFFGPSSLLSYWSITGLPLGFGLGDRAAIGPYKPFLCFCCCYLGRLCFTGRFCLLACRAMFLDYATTLFTLIMSLADLFFHTYRYLPTYLPTNILLICSHTNTLTHIYSSCIRLSALLCRRGLFVGLRRFSRSGKEDEEERDRCRWRERVDWI